MVVSSLLGLRASQWLLLCVACAGCTSSLWEGEESEPAEGATVAWVQNMIGHELVALARQSEGVVVMDSTGTLWAFTADGALRWTVRTDGLGVSAGAGASVPLVAIGEVVIVTSVDIDGAQVQAWSAAGDMVWTSTPMLPGTSARVGPFGLELRADGEDGVWLVVQGGGGACDGDRYAWLRFSVADGVQTAAEWRCEGAGLTLDDGRVVQRQGTDPHAALVAIDDGAPWRLSLPDGYAAVPVDGAQLALYPRAGAGSTLIANAAVGPVALVDSSGDLRWQWPGTLQEGQLAPQPSGLCRGLVAGAPDGDLYVASQACAGTRALLGAAGAEFDDTNLLVARIHVHGGEPARCGNGWLDPDEACDGEDFPLLIDSTSRVTLVDGRACSNWLDGAGWQGEASCTADCQIDTDPCVNSCGNDQVDPGEQCDGPLRTPDGSTCPGTLMDTPCVECRYDASDCPPPPPPDPTCGNGRLDDMEDCDGNVFLWESPCDEYFVGQASGPAACRDDCRADLSVCDVCQCTDCERPALCP